MIKNIFNPGVYAKRINISLLILRLAGGGLMLTHGIGKIAPLFGTEPIQFPDPIGLGASTTLALTVFSEVLCSILLIFGLASRLTAIPLLTTMLVAAFIFHANDPFANQELPLLYSALYLVILITGAGKFSIDNWIFKILNRQKKYN
ncbi:DoxX family protein [Aequorivita viscosa]|uniref:Putative oxidoreductase n=1 Tax=Aequorivita viscosa TaxID=797419 RepID=A0A1M6ERR3_9FLAO|nr:DoxX family protein [Aequorivita viscosa]SDW04610.1 putative oxidoreductase [Aequorivita viscosa]SHI88113.1 putative oxidoreductase [Aequorivita viscosa]